MQKERSSGRRTVAVPAFIETGYAKLEGTIYNVSATGAKVRMSSATALKDGCTLTAAVFPTPVPCLVMWSRGQEVGLRFKKAVALML